MYTNENVILPCRLELVSKLWGGVLEVEVWEVACCCCCCWDPTILGFFVPEEVERDEPAVGLAPVGMTCLSLRRAAETHVLFTWVEQSKPRLLQHVLHRLCLHSFFAWFPQSWHVAVPDAPEPDPELFELVPTVVWLVLLKWRYCVSWLLFCHLRLFPRKLMSVSSTLCWGWPAVRIGITPTPSAAAAAASDPDITPAFWWWWYAGATRKTSRRPAIPISVAAADDGKP